MKLLMIYAERFSYKPNAGTLESAIDISQAGEANDVQVGLIQVEKDDEDEIRSKETKLVKNLKWAAKKNGTNKIVLHSFAHLSESKASPAVTKLLLDNCEKRLLNSGYEAAQTPFGYFLDLELKTPGLSLARIFKEL